MNATGCICVCLCAPLNGWVVWQWAVGSGRGVALRVGHTKRFQSKILPHKSDAKSFALRSAEAGSPLGYSGSRKGRLGHFKSKIYENLYIVIKYNKSMIVLLCYCVYVFICFLTT